MKPSSAPSTVCVAPFGNGERHHLTTEARFAVLGGNAFHQLQKFIVVVGKTAADAGKTRGENSRRSIQIIDFQAGIIRQGDLLGELGDLISFFLGVFFQRFAVFDDLRRAGKIVQRDEINGDNVEDRHDFFYFVLIVRRQDNGKRFESFLGCSS